MSEPADPAISTAADDPNAATRNQVMVKRAERAIRRYCDSDLLLTLDGICLLNDEALMKSEMVNLSKTLEQRAQEVGKAGHAEAID